MTAQREPEALSVGLLTDDGLPRQLAGRIAEGLPAWPRISTTGRPGTSSTRRDRCHLTRKGNIPMLALAEEHRAEHEWDLVVLITDLPRRAGTVPIASDYNVAHGVAMVSLPALGALRP
ncbi:hypothetical protein [Amycolatopsis methanolica]|uniref:hypothetical protein n=1 Tax=Amycolatopsis methanolica TaxID=1814 RepID=UPI00343E3C15